MSKPPIPSEIVRLRRKQFEFRKGYSLTADGINILRYLAVDAFCAPTEFYVIVIWGRNLTDRAFLTEIQNLVRAGFVVRVGKRSYKITAVGMRALVESLEAMAGV